MSNLPPPLPPDQPNYPSNMPPSNFPPNYGPPQPPPKKGLSGCAIAAIVVGVIIGLAAIGIAVSSYVFVKSVGGGQGLAKTAIAVTNPDYEILDIDQKEQMITVKHKKTGKQATIPLANLKNGRIDPADLGLTEEQAGGTGDAPGWLRYPGSKVLTSAQFMGMTTLILETTASVQEVNDYYFKQFGDHGLKASTPKQGAIVSEDATGSFNLAIAEKNGSTSITVLYKKK